MQLTLLGTGPCVSQLPGVPNRYPPSFLIKFSREKVLFECPESIRFRLEEAGYDYAGIHHLAISHIHPDHFALIHYIQSVFCKGLYNKKFRNKELHIYCPNQIKENFNAYWNMHLPELAGKRFDWPKLFFHAMSGKNKSSRIGSAILSSQNVYHGFGKTDALGFRFKTSSGVIAYSGDTGACEGIKKIAKDADIFICDASSRVSNSKTTSDYGHLTPFGAGEIAKEAKVKKLILIHYFGVDSDKLMLNDCKKSGFKGEIIIGKDLQKFKI